MEYRVSWRIDVDAENPHEAAQQALDVMRDPESTAVVFNVTPHGAALTTIVDLDEEPEFDGPSCERCGVQPAASCECE